MRLKFVTAGESHGKGLVAIVEGLPAGLPVTADWVDQDLGRRMLGYGRGARMKIERDRVEFLSGIRAGETLGSPVAMLVRNRDWENWEDVMAAEGTPGDLRRRRVTRPRPGHADLVGVLKYDRLDARDILERASARETVARVAAGALARRLLDEFGVDVGSHVVSIGGIRASAPAALPRPLNAAADRSEIRVLDPAVETEIIARIDRAKKDGDTLGGEIEVVARGLVVGLGSHVSWDRKLDARLAGILMSIPAVKGVEIGLGFEAARRPGSAVHDPIGADATAAPAGADGGPPVPGDPRGGFARSTNNAGGLEGGMTTGRAAGGPRRHEADLDADVAAADGGSRLRRAGERAERALGRDRGAGDGRHRRGSRGDRARRRHAREVRRRQPRRDEAQRGGIRRRAWRALDRAQVRRRRDRMSRRHILLVGLPGSGKTTVGRLVCRKAGGAPDRRRQPAGAPDGDAGRPDLRQGG